MLYHDVLKLERSWKGFNRKQFSSKELIELAHSLGITVATDYFVEKGAIVNFKGKKAILYNPHQPELELAMTIGHELGHYALGHVSDEGGLYGPDPFSFKGIEKGAGIIGFLFWQPTHQLHRYPEMKEIPERLFDSMRHFSDEVKEDDLARICRGRFRIYRAFNRVNLDRGKS